ncbi:hypothetical protein NP493_23g01039 [Ridgeia piscesae]|uniref:Uncharacterized protein n=1 Tax=Ridgeia piscesae TaxID=27915 RepID=A0AAD9PDD6_RIDPI|nr:hypothetical protein NP493_23g01039 [Ridgeia piscesae]
MREFDWRVRRARQADLFRQLFRTPEVTDRLLGDDVVHEEVLGAAHEHHVAHVRRMNVTHVIVTQRLAEHDLERELDAAFLQQHHDDLLIAALVQQERAPRISRERDFARLGRERRRADAFESL